MARGRKPLDPELRLQRRHASLQRYAEKNSDALRAAARLRMQRKRAEISEADYKTQAAYKNKAREAAEKYRDRKAREACAADAANRLLRKKPAPKPTTKPRFRGETRPTIIKQFKSRPDHQGVRAQLPTAASKYARDGDEDAPSDSDSCGEHHERRAEAPLFPGYTQPRTTVPAPCLECGEGGCPGCACMCMESQTHQNQISHQPSSLSTIMSALAQCCTPVFLPDPGHEDKIKHSASKDTWFYGVISEGFQGIVTSEESMNKLTAKDADARTFKARTWADIERLWDDDCADNHTHDGRPPLAVVDILSDSTASRAASPTKAPLSRAASPTKAALSRAASPSKGARRPPLPTKPDTTAGQKVGVRFEIPRFHAANHNPPCQQAIFDTAAIAAQFEAWSSNKAAGEQSLMFAVSGTNRIFRDRHRALAAFLETPGGELFFTYDEDAVYEFIEKEAAEMLKKKGTA
ncbi:hypothetical protein B0H13DRAFT_1903721 [Mycena leptocephala]|nr:hypothetical protein B0H13DRAFT_1903721 [Mycena leptocephala]